MNDQSTSSKRRRIAMIFGAGMAAVACAAVMLLIGVRQPAPATVHDPSATAAPPRRANRDALSITRSAESFDGSLPSGYVPADKLDVVAPTPSPSSLPQPPPDPLSVRPAVQNPNGVDGARGPRG